MMSALGTVSTMSPHRPLVLSCSVPPKMAAASLRSRHRSRDRPNIQDHRGGTSMELPLPHTGKAHEPKSFVEGDRTGFRVRPQPAAADLIPLGQRLTKHMPDQRAPKPQPLCASVHAQAGQAQHWERVVREALSESLVRDRATLDAP